MSFKLIIDDMMVASATYVALAADHVGLVFLSLVPVGWHSWLNETEVVFKTLTVIGTCVYIWVRIALAFRKKDKYERTEDN